MTQITEPFPIFYDTDGTPLENGMIYVGSANQDPRANPVQVYVDDALTVQIAQPIRTLGGRPAYQGAPINLFVAAASYSVAVFNKRGAPVTYSQDATSYATSAELAASTGAALIGKAGGGTVQDAIGAFEPTTVKVGRSVEIRDTGAVGLNGAGDAAAIDTLLSTVTPGRKITATRTSAAAAAFKKQDAPFVLSRGVDLELEIGVDLRIDQTAGTRDNVIEVDVTLTSGEVTPTTVGEWRGGHITGGRLFTNALSGLQVDSGGYGIAVHNGASKSIIGLTIEKQTIGGGLGAIRFNSQLNRTGSGNETQWCQIVRCTLDGTTRFEAEDGLIAVDCVAIGRVSGGPAYEWDMTRGAFCSGVFRGTAAGIGGAAQIVNGSMVKMHNVQIEHAGTAATGLLGGAQIVVLGQDYKSQAVEIVGCNIGAGSFVTNTINLFNANGTIIDRCQFNIAGGGTSADLNLNRDASSAARDTDNTVIGYANNFRGARAIRAAGDLTDVTRRMIITHTGGALRKQHRGMWFPLLSLLTDPATDLAASGLECMIDHSGAIRFNGCFTRATFFGAGVTVGTLPAWLRPNAIQRFPIVGAGGTSAVGVVLANGLFGIEGTGLAASTELWMPNGAWNVVVNPDYVDPDL